ncbi:serine/threonine-protein kinase [bacterium]|nr:serine/threonine-protein kinase [bacterium]
MTKEHSNSDCPSEEKLARLLSGEMPPERESVIESHVMTCTVCESRLAKLSDTEHLQRWRKLLSDQIEDSPASPGESASVRIPAESVAEVNQASKRRDFANLVADFEAEGFSDLQEVGFGGMGQVFRATQDKLNRFVAIKVLHPVHPDNNDSDRRRRFQLEATAISDVDDEHVLKIHGAGEVGGRMYLILEFVEGPNLGSFIARQPQDPLSTAKIVQQISRGVAAAHQRNIVHRDLKPANILLKQNEGMSENGRSTTLENYTVKVADFGLAKALNPNEKTQPEFTQTHQLVGTPAYMSPEQIAGHRSTVGFTSDVYSIGVLMYEMLTGTLPFNGKTPFQLLSNIEALDPISPRRQNKQIPVELEAICLKCVEKKPKSRYQNAEALHADLNRFLQGIPVVARKPGVLRVATKWMQRNPSRALLAATLLFAAVASLIVWAGVTGRLASLNAELTEKNSSLDKQRQVTQQINSFLQNDILKQAAADSQINWLNETGTGPGSYIRNPSLKSILDRVAQNLLQNLDAISFEPVVAAELLKTVGETYRSLGEHDAAIEILTHALERFPNNELESIAQTERELALCKIAVADFGAAKTMLMQSKKNYQRLGEKFATHLLLLDHDLAELYLLANFDSDETIELAINSYQGLSEQLGPTHADTLLATSTLGRAKLKLNQNQEALRLLEYVSEQTSKSVGDLHPSSIGARFQLARAKVDSMQLDEGYELFDQVWRQAKSTLGDEHPTTFYYQLFAAKNNWANLNQSMSSKDKLRRNREAVVLLEKAQKQFLQLYHERHPVHLEVAAMLSEVYTRTGENDKLIGLCTDAIARLKPSSSLNQKRILSYELLEASAWMAKSELEKATTIYKKCLVGCSSAYGEDHEMTSDVLRQLGRCYLASGKLDLAAETLAPAYWKQCELHGAENMSTLQTGMALLNCYNQLENYIESEKLSQHLLDNLDEGVSENSVLSITFRKFHAISIFNQGRSKDAEPLLRQIADDYLREFPNRYQGFQMKALHAASLRDLDRLDEAVAVALDAWEGIDGNTDNFPNDRIRTRVMKETARILESIYDSLGDDGTAKKWQSKFESIQ